MDALPESAFIRLDTVMSKALRAISERDNAALEDALRLWSGTLIQADTFTSQDTDRLLDAAVKSGSAQLVKTVMSGSFINVPSYDGLVRAKAAAEAANSNEAAESLSELIQQRANFYEKLPYQHLRDMLSRKTPFFNSEEMKLLSNLIKKREEHLRRINPAELAIGKLARQGGRKSEAIESEADELFFYYILTGNAQGLEALDSNGLITKDYDKLLPEDVLNTKIPNVEAVSNVLYSIIERRIDADTGAAIERTRREAEMEKARYLRMLGVKSAKKGRSVQ